MIFGDSLSPCSPRFQVSPPWTQVNIRHIPRGDTPVDGQLFVPESYPVAAIVMASTMVIPLRETNGLETQHLLFMWGERKHSCSPAILSPVPRRSWEHFLSLVSFSAPLLAPAFGSLATCWVKTQHSSAQLLLAVFRPVGLKR